MAYGWNLLEGNYRLLGGGLGVDLLGGVMDFNTADGFGIVLENWIDFGARECEGLRGSRGAERIDRFKQVLPGDVNT